MEKLRRHEDFGLAHVLLGLAIRAVVLGFEAVAVGPGVQDDAVLNIIFMEERLQLVVEASLITVRPEQYRRVIDIAGDHFLNELEAHDSLVSPVPATQLTVDIESEGVAGIEKFGVGRIM